MEIEPIRLLWMTVAALLLGMTSGVLNDVHRAIKVFFGVSYDKSGAHTLENIQIPIIKRSLGPIKESKVKKRLLPFIMLFQDIFLFVFMGVGVAVLDYYFNNGRPRLYTPVAAIVGFVIYYLTFGKLACRLFGILSFALRAVFAVIFEIIYRPLHHFVEIFGIFAKKIYANVKKTIAKKQKMVYNNNKEKIVMKEAAFGYLKIAKK